MLAKFVLALIGAGLLWQATDAAQIKPVRRVLIVNVFSPLASPGVAALDQAIVARLEESPYQIELYSESLDITLFPDEAHQEQFRSWYIGKYRDRKPDVIIAVGPEPIRFMARSHKESFPGTPIIFCGSTEEMLGGLKLDSDLTGVWAVAEPEKTLIAALHLQPETRHVVVVGGVGASDRYLENSAAESFQRYERQFEFTYLTGLDMPALLERLKHLPEHTIIYYTSITQDAAGAHLIDATQSVPMIVSAANAPVFVVDDVDLGKGTVGGDLLSWATDGKDAAALAVRVLNGEKTKDIGIGKSANAYMFDWRALKRWGINEKNLPAGSLVLNRQPTFWEAYKTYVIAAILVLLVQTVVIFGLLWQRAQRRKTQTELRKSEEALQGVNRRLIEAQEQERVRIARELHDDINQRMAMLEVDLDELGLRLPDSAADLQARLEGLRARVSGISTDVQAISHRLHSSKLEYLGLAAACRSFCKELSERHKVSIEFQADTVPPDVPKDVSLTLFRVLQESLQNAIKHSGAQHFEVHLQVMPGEIQLTVRDDGVGFDVAAAMNAQGLGLISMRERVSLVKGTIVIGSRPKGGTEINVRVPIIEANGANEMASGAA